MKKDLGHAESREDTRTNLYKKLTSELQALVSAILPIFVTGALFLPGLHLRADRLLVPLRKSPPFEALVVWQPGPVPPEFAMV